jgi:hypothetical protein
MITFSLLIIFSIISLVVIHNLQGTASNQITTNNLDSDFQEYTFAELGIFIEPLSWSNTGVFHITLNKTFDLENLGPALLLLDFTSEGDKPDSPGYEIEGEFNSIRFESVIAKAIIPIETTTKNSISIPLNTQGRIYGNNLFLNISCQNEMTSSKEGILTISETSRLLVGDSLLIDSFGDYASTIYPNSLSGITSLGGIKVSSFIQLTINNETLIQNAEHKINLEITLDGDISLSALLYDETDSVSVFSKNETSTTTLTASAKFQPILGVNYCEIEFSIYGGSLWSTTFNISITNCHILLEESQGGFGFGFGDLEIPFFQWPAVPIVGVIVLLLWVLPYSVLKYREWKKLPNEVELNYLEDDEELNILDPNGITTEDDDDDIDETYDVWEDD